MKLSKHDKKAYKKFDGMLEKAHDIVMNDKRLKGNLIRWGEFDKKTLSEALTYGKGPLVQVETLNAKNAAGEDRCGYTTPILKKNKVTGRSKVRIHKSLVERFEALNDNLLTQTVFMTLLHELCHWGDWRDKKPMQDAQGNVVEEGLEFEQAAQGNPDGFVSYCINAGDHLTKIGVHWK